MSTSDWHYELKDDGSLHFPASERSYRVRREGGARPVVTIKRNDLLVCTDRVDLGSVKARRAFAALCSTEEGAAVERELVVVGEVMRSHCAGDDSDDQHQRSSQADLLVSLASDLELFHDKAGKAVASATVDGHIESYRVRSRSFQQWLARTFFERHNKVAGSQAMQDALNVIEGQAIYGGRELPVYRRMAAHADAVYVDLGADDWAAVEIDQHGWRIVDHAPVKFVRGSNMAALPRPKENGSLADFRDLLSFTGQDEDAWVLLQAWIMGSMKPEGPYPLLVLQGEQGSSKSTLSRFLKALIDPSAAPIRSQPKGQQDLAIAANANRLLAFDNLSHISASLSDGLCRLSTGGGFATRELYTDTDEVVLDVQCPVILNGISELATRADLLDRCIILELPSIASDRRMSERELTARFDQVLPSILGALYTAVSVALRNLPTTKLEELPRLADFALWVTAAESALDMQPGAYLAAYASNRSTANEVTLSASIIADPIRALLERQQFWAGTATGLMETLAELVDVRTPRGPLWPKSPIATSNELRRIEPNLRAVGIATTFYRQGGSGQRMIALELIEHATMLSSQSSRASPPAQEPLSAAQSAVTMADAVSSPPSESRHTVAVPDSAGTSEIEAVSDECDAGDDPTVAVLVDLDSLLADLAMWTDERRLDEIGWPIEYESGHTANLGDLPNLISMAEEAVARRAEAAVWGERTLRALHAAISLRIDDHPAESAAK